MLNARNTACQNLEARIRFTEAGSEHLNGGSPLLGESTFLSLSSLTIACLAIAGRAKLNCCRRDIGFEPNSCLAFVKFSQHYIEKWLPSNWTWQANVETWVCTER